MISNQFEKIRKDVPIIQGYLIDDWIKKNIYSQSRPQGSTPVLGLDIEWKPQFVGECYLNIQMDTVLIGNML